MQIALADVSKSFGSLKALDSVSLSLDPGQIVVLLGPNGAGKTTLMRCLSAVIAPDRGEIQYDGERLRHDRLDLRRRLFFIPDFPYFYPQMPLLNYIGMVINIYECDREGLEDRVISLMKEFEILTLADCAMGTLSRGQSYKGALVAHLAIDPDIWMLDEPFASGMDPRGLSAFKRNCNEAIKRGRTIIYSTQIVDVVEQFANQICVINKGKLRTFPSLADLHQELLQPGSPLAGFLGDLEEDA